MLGPCGDCQQSSSSILPGVFGSVTQMAGDGEKKVTPEVIAAHEKELNECLVEVEAAAKKAKDAAAWGHFRVTLGSLWVTLGSLWGHFGVTLGSLLGRLHVNFIKFDKISSNSTPIIPFDACVNIMCHPFSKKPSSSSKFSMNDFE